MILFGPHTVLTVFILFCRIGACLMLMPGFSSARLPAQIRLFIALAITLVVAPIEFDAVAAAVGDLSATRIVGVIVSELLVGMMIGLIARIFFLALEMLAHAASMSIGLGPVPGTAIEDNEPLPALVSLITLSAVFLFFVTGQYWEILRGLFASYTALPVARPFGPQLALSELTRALSSAFFLSLRIASPFVIYAIVVNFSIGIINKLVPQIPVYFISLPFILIGGLLLLYFVAPEMLLMFSAALSSFLARG